MRKFIALISIFILCCAAMISCGGTEEAPEGLQVVKISKEHGFKFYGPEGWTVLNAKIDSDTEVYATKMSSVNNTSITLAKAPMPEGDIKDYFNKSLKEFPSSIGDTLTVVTEPAKTNFGNAKEAYKVVYTYKYQGYDFACMQVFAKNGSDFYIFTYTSYGDVTDETSDYRIYLEAAELAIEKFEFTAKEAVNEDAPEYEKDADGYKLVSDSAIAGYSLYIPEEYEVIVSDAYVTAKISEGANISMSKATSVGISILKYLEDRKNELSALTDNVTDLAITLKTDYNPDSPAFDDWKMDVMPTVDKKLTFGDIADNHLIGYEYTYEYGGVKYHVYQVLGVDAGVLGSSIGASGYVFTYTATEAEYAEHIDEIRLILKKVRF